jgi:hypothetical protein
MLIKKSDAASRSLAYLEALARSGPPARRHAAEAEGQRLRAGAQAEAEIACLIDFAFAETEDMAVIHDLRLDENGRVAAVDHLLIHASLHVFVLATRAAPFGVQVTDEGEFRRWNPRTRAYEDMASPLAVNERHIAVLREALAPLLPLRLDGTDWQPVWHSLVVVPARARIDRPPHFDTRRVIKADLLPDAVALALRDAGPGLSAEQTGQLARRLAGWHRPQVLPRSIEAPGDGLAAPDDPAQWRLEPLAGAAPEPAPKRRWWPFVLLSLALAGALWAGAEFLRDGAPKPATVAPPGRTALPAAAEPLPPASAPPQGIHAGRTRPLPTELPPKPPRRRPLHPPPPEPLTPAPAATGSFVPPESAPRPAAVDGESVAPTAAPTASPAPATPPDAVDLSPKGPAVPPPLERPKVEVDAHSIRARVGDGRSVAEIRGNLPRIREQMRNSSLGIEPANPGRPAVPECRPGAVMTDAEIEACRRQARERP